METFLSFNFTSGGELLSSQTQDISGKGLVEDFDFIPLSEIKYLQGRLILIDVTVYDNLVQVRCCTCVSG
jgi:hypothetical protein